VSSTGFIHCKPISQSPRNLLILLVLLITFLFITYKIYHKDISISVNINASLKICFGFINNLFSRKSGRVAGYNIFGYKNKGEICYNDSLIHCKRYYLSLQHMSVISAMFIWGYKNKNSNMNLKTLFLSLICDIHVQYMWFSSLKCLINICWMISLYIWTLCLAYSFVQQNKLSTSTRTA
jgi:hypothetical protein